VEKGGNCLSGGKAMHLVNQHLESMHQSGRADQQASFSPTTVKPAVREISGAGLGSFATFLAHQEK